MYCVSDDVVIYMYIYIYHLRTKHVELLNNYGNHSNMLNIYVCNYKLHNDCVASQLWLWKILENTSRKIFN